MLAALLSANLWLAQICGHPRQGLSGLRVLPVGWQLFTIKMSG